MKNCSACKGFHEAPFGRYCKLKNIKLCAACGNRHRPPFGRFCPSSVSTMSKDGKPITGDFLNRDDPKYLQYLEESFMASQEASGGKTAELDIILRRVEALEARSQLTGQPAPPIPVGHMAMPGSGLGLYAGTGGRPKTGAAGGGSLPNPNVNPNPNLNPNHNPNQNPAPADVVVGPLTEALEKLSLAVDPAASSHKLQGTGYKPEYYVQHIKGGVPLKQINHTKLSYREMVYGWFCILQHLIKVEGDVNSYLAHCRYVSQQAMASQFLDSAYVGYDRQVISNVISGESDTFEIGDPFAVATFFHAGNLLPAKVKTKPKSNRWFKKQNDRSAEEGHKSSSVPGNFPEDVCYAYNFKRCTGSCSKKHVCKSCGGNHRAVGCQEKESKND